MNEHQNRMCINETIYQEEKNGLIMCVSGIISLIIIMFFMTPILLHISVASIHYSITESICYRSLISTQLVIQTLF